MTNKELRAALLAFIGNFSATMLGEVRVVNKTQCTCIVRNDGVDYYGVRLRPATGANIGVVMFPKVGSQILLAKVDEAEEWAMIAANEYESIEILIDSLVLNNGSLGGLVKIQELTDKLNAFVNLFNTHTHSFIGVAPSSPGTTSAAMAQVQPFNKSDYENTKIKH